MPEREWSIRVILLAISQPFLSASATMAGQQPLNALNVWRASGSTR
jgi:hypothetical protein